MKLKTAQDFVYPEQQKLAAYVTPAAHHTLALAPSYWHRLVASRDARTPI